MEADDARFAEWLTDQHIGTLAPDAATWMIHTAEEVVQAALSLPKGDPLRARAKAYAVALLRVAKDMGTQQGVVIGRVSVLVDEASGQDVQQIRTG